MAILVDGADGGGAATVAGGAVAEGGGGDARHSWKRVDHSGVGKLGAAVAMWPGSSLTLPVARVAGGSDTGAVVATAGVVVGVAACGMAVVGSRAAVVEVTWPEDDVL